MRPMWQDRAISTEMLDLDVRIVATGPVKRL